MTSAFCATRDNLTKESQVTVKCIGELAEGFQEAGDTEKVEKVEKVALVWDLA